VGQALASWTEGPSKAAAVDFVERVRSEGVPPDERVAVFDNDGTLWCEKPMPAELGFILHRFVEMAEEDPALRDRQPWKAAWDKDYAWAEESLDRARGLDWTVVSMKSDWSTVFAEAPAR